MPVEPKAKVKRRATRRDPDEYKFDGSSHARELELKRSRGMYTSFMPKVLLHSQPPGEISCAEYVLSHSLNVLFMFFRCRS